MFSGTVTESFTIELTNMFQNQTNLGRGLPMERVENTRQK